MLVVKKFDKLCEDLRTGYNFDFSIKIYLIMESERFIIGKCIKNIFNDTETSLMDISNNLKTNIKLMFLDEIIIPTDIIDAFNKHNIIENEVKKHA